MLLDDIMNDYAFSLPGEPPLPPLFIGYIRLYFIKDEYKGPDCSMLNYAHLLWSQMGLDGAHILECIERGWD